MLREAGNIGGNGLIAGSGMGAPGPRLGLALAAPAPLLRLPRRSPARTLALATDQPDDHLLDRPAESWKANLISPSMFRLMGLQLADQVHIG